MKYLQITTLIILTSVFGCKDPELVGLDTINDTVGLGLEQVDTFTIAGSYFLVDSLVTSNLTSYLMGGMNDPILGKVSSKLYTQFHLGSSNVVFPDDAVIDSVIVYLKYAGSYGKTDRFSGYQTVNVYKLDEDIREDETYTQESTHAEDGGPIASVGFQPDLYNGTTISYLIGTAGNDTIEIDTLELAPYLRIPIDNDYGQTILDAEANVLDSNVHFIERFKGLIFEPQVDELAEGSGAILYFDMANPETRMRLYYHEDESGETGLYDLFVGTGAATHTSFHHEYPQTILADTANELAGEQSILVQSVGGIGSKISFPGLSNLTKDAAGNDVSIAINKAELIFPIEAETFSEFSPPLRLDLEFIPVDTLDPIPLIDDIFEDPNHFGGELNTSTLEYTFNVARQLQWFINRDVEFPEFLVYTENQEQTGYRAILNGTKHPLRPIKLRVTFTRID